MKKIIYVILLFTLMTLKSWSSGYWYRGEYVSLRSQGVSYVLPSGVDKGTMSRMYSSDVYTTMNGRKVVVLPRVLLSVKNNSVVRQLKSQFVDVITTVVDNGVYLALDVNIQTSEEVLKLVESISKTPEVEWCEPDVLLQLIGCEDSYYRYQYYVHNNTNQNVDINAERAWQLVPATSSVTVAVIDDGIYRQHEDLVPNVITGYTVGHPDGDGTPLNANEVDVKSHGTSCAGIIGAIHNEVGIRGVAKGVKLLPVNINPEMAQQATHFVVNSETSNAIIRAAQTADILSCSWSVDVPMNAMTSAIDNAVRTGRNGKGCICAFAAGNGGAGVGVAYPANLSSTIAVGAIDRVGTRCSYSQTGPEIDIVAFGGYSDIATTAYMNGAGTYSMSFGGTSAACPQVAGVAALMLSANPDLTSSRVKEIIKNTARDLGTAGRDDWYGYGLVDAAQAIAVALGDKMRLAGADIVAGAETYTISDLPAGCAVQWSFRSNGRVSYVPSLSPLAQGSVSVRNTAHVAFGGDLVATVCFPDSTISPYIISRTITGDGPLTGLYREATSSYDCPLVDDEYDTNTATPGRMVTMTSNNFSHRNVSYSSPRGSHNCIETDGRVQFEMPQLAEGETADFTVSGGGVPSVLHFKFEAPYSCYNASRRVVKTLQGQTLRVRASGGERDAQVNGMIDNPKY